MRLKNKSARSDWSYVYFTLMSPMIVHSATAKLQHFDRLGQVLRQNCPRHLQTFQIFLSSAIPALLQFINVLNSVFLFTFRGCQAKTGKRVTENTRVSGGPEMLPRLSRNAPQVRVRELTWSSEMKLFLFVPNGKYTFKMISLRKIPITPILSSYLHDRHL